MSEFQLNSSELSLICWCEWHDGPISGLVAWKNKLYWFKQFSCWEDTENLDSWGYNHQLFELSHNQIVDALNWFQEKKDWSINRAPSLRKLVAEIEDLDVRQNEISKRGLALRDWNGPNLTEPHIAIFSDKKISGEWFDSNKWCLSDSFEKSSYFGKNI